MDAPPPPPAPGWTVPPPAAPRRTYFGLPLLTWVVAWLPLAPTAFMGAIAPGFIAPLFDTRVSLLGLPFAAWLLVLPLINLLVATVTHNDTPTALSIGVTTFIGFNCMMFGPAFVLIMINLGSTSESWRPLAHG